MTEDERKRIAARLAAAVAAKGLTVRMPDWASPLGIPLADDAVPSSIPLQCKSCKSFHRSVPIWGIPADDFCSPQCRQSYEAREALRRELDEAAREEEELERKHAAEQKRIDDEASAARLRPKPVHDCSGCVRCRYDWRAMAAVPPSYVPPREEENEEMKQASGSASRRRGRDSR